MFLSACRKYWSKVNWEEKDLDDWKIVCCCAVICSVVDACFRLSLEHDGLQNCHPSDQSGLSMCCYAVLILMLSHSTQTSFQVRSDLFEGQLWPWQLWHDWETPRRYRVLETVSHFSPGRNEKRRSAAGHIVSVKCLKIFCALWCKEHKHVFITFHT